jgi:hypothetical protein
MRVAIIGAGPSGLDAALACREQGWDVDVYERAPHAAAAVRHWGHVRMFTPWEMNRSPRMDAALGRADIAVPDGEVPPTGAELADQLIEPLLATAELADAVHVGCEVVEVGRAGLSKEQEIASDVRAARPFRLILREKGRERAAIADAVIDATGMEFGAGPLGEGGVAAPGERALSGLIERRIPDLPTEAARFSCRTTLLAGSGHSAQTAIAGLADVVEAHPGTTVLWVTRAAHPDWGSPSDDPLPDRAALAACAERVAAGDVAGIEFLPGLSVQELSQTPEGIEVALDGPAGPRTVRADQILSLTGSRADATLHRQLQVHECYATGAPINLSAKLLGDAAGDCLTQPDYGPDVLRNPEPGFFIIGAKSYGRAPNYLMRTGFGQAEGVVRLIADDHAALSA